MPKKKIEDDGRSYTNMNVEGMPWYRPDVPVTSEEKKPDLDPKETRAAMWGTLKAALLIVLIYAAVFFLFILFCDVVWFKNF